MAPKNLNTWLKSQGLTHSTSENTAAKKSSPQSSSHTKRTSPTQKSQPKTQTQTKPLSAKKPTSPRTKNSPRRTSSHDPLSGRPTLEKRERFHPTKFLKPHGKAEKLRILPLGGMEEVGLNMMIVEYGQDIIVLDMGLLFPSEEHLGVDVLIPDITYLEKRKKDIKGVFFTHGHLDHIGAVPYLAQKLGFPPMYASRLTKEFILSTSAEHLNVKQLKITELTPKSRVKIGALELEFFHVNHSIPEGLGVVINTPYGAVVHSSDFKIDHNPSDDMPADLGKLSRIGAKGVLLAMVDSTNALKPGHTLSESIIERELQKTILDVKGRLIITTFASTIGRLARIIETAEKAGRTVFLSGRSMERNIAIARKLNYLRCKDATLQQMSSKAEKMPPSKVLILSTGSQGEELAALTRMASGIHRDVKLTPQDTIIFSSSPIPGNEMAIVAVLNNLSEIGCKVINKEMADIYVSGHGHKEEVKLLTHLLNPKYFAPIHGELYMRHGHRDIVVNELGIRPENTFIMKNGQGLVFEKDKARLMTPQESLNLKPVMIEMGETINEHILGDRHLMADGGALFISVQHQGGKLKHCEIRSRGFRYMGAKHEIFEVLCTELRSTFQQVYDPKRSPKALEETLCKTAERVLLQKFKKNALVEVIVE